MPALFDTILLLDERPRPGVAAWNMALDEALLTGGQGPLLRVYRWAEPAVSFGYFLPWEEAEKVAHGRPVMRRWTGGGLVEHGEDFTWSLIVPTRHPVSRLRPAASYGTFHAALADAMRAAGMPVEQVDVSAPAPAGGLCMTAPAPGDLLRDGKKIAGAGQRRCRHGLLHQGSIFGVSLPGDFPARLAAALSGSVESFLVEKIPRAEAEGLVLSRYGTDAWLRKAPP